MWLEYLCLSSESRGLGGYELAECTELLAMSVLTALSDGSGCEARAHTLRALFRAMYEDSDAGSVDSDPDEATLMLLGLTPGTWKQPRPVRRQKAALAMGIPLNTFQKGYEPRLLRDAAHDLWRLEAGAALPRP